MKYSIFLILVLCGGSVMGQAYISSTGDVKLESSIESYSSPDITVHPQYNPLTETYLIELRVYDSGVLLESFIRSYTFSISKTTVDTFTGTGTGDTEKWYNAVLQAVVDYLEAINGSIFTINS